MRSRAIGTLALGGSLLAVSLVALTQTVGAKSPNAAAAGPACPSFDSNNFHKPTKIDNPYFPLDPGDLYTYFGNVKKTQVKDVVYVTRNTKLIDGVLTVEVRDQVYEDGVLAEDTLDWYGQDDQGNVWYFGELSTQLPANTTTGSWTAGLAGAQPGYIMEAAPQVGDAYCQENAPGIAQDAGSVVSLTASRSVQYGSFTNVLQTKDYSLIEPHSEYKFYARGVGEIESFALNGGSGNLQLYTLRHNQ
jgi:hypothetical protein